MERYERATMRCYMYTYLALSPHPNTLLMMLHTGSDTLDTPCHLSATFGTICMIRPVTPVGRPVGHCCSARVGLFLE